MAATPGFNDLKARFDGYSQETIIKSEPQVTDADQVQVIESFFTYARQYFEDDTFRETLIKQRRQNLESRISEGLDLLNQITDSRANGSFPERIQPIVDDLANKVEELDLKFVRPLTDYALGGKSDVAKSVRGLRASEKQATKTLTDIQDVLRKANLLVGEGSEAELYAHFQKLANGKSVEENDGSTTPPPTRMEERGLTHNHLIALYLLAVTALTVYIIWAAPSIHQWLFPQPDHNRRLTLAIQRLGAFIPFVAAAALIAHLKLRKLKGGYEKAAAMWAVWAVVSVALTAVAAIVLIHQLGQNPGWDSLVPRIVSLLAPAYFVRLCVQNYRANKHLAVLNTHRATISRVVGAFAKNLATDRQEESLQLESLRQKGSIYLKAAELVFDPGETGFLTRGTGAGSSDNFFEDLPKVR